MAVDFLSVGAAGSGQNLSDTAIVGAGAADAALAPFEEIFAAAGASAASSDAAFPALGDIDTDEADATEDADAASSAQFPTFTFTSAFALPRPSDVNVDRQQPQMPALGDLQADSDFPQQNGQLSSSDAQDDEASQSGVQSEETDVASPPFEPPLPAPNAKSKAKAPGEDGETVTDILPLPIAFVPPLDLDGPLPDTQPSFGAGTDLNSTTNTLTSSAGFSAASAALHPSHDAGPFTMTPEPAETDTGTSVNANGNANDVATMTGNTSTNVLNTSFARTFTAAQAADIAPLVASGVLFATPLTASDDQQLAQLQAVLPELDQLSAAAAASQATSVQAASDAGASTAALMQIAIDRLAALRPAQRLVATSQGLIDVAKLGGPRATDLLGEASQLIVRPAERASLLAARTAPMAASSHATAFELTMNETSTATSQALGSLPNEDANMSSIVQTMKMQVRNGGGSAVVNLQPEFLGEVTIDLQVANGTVTATLHAANPEVRAWLQANEATLRQGLANQGLTLDRFEVTEESALDKRDSSDRRRRQQAQADQDQRPAKSPDDSATFTIVV